MPGVGKTSLARMMYNDAKFIRHFDCRAWVTVPHHHAPPIGYFERRLREQLGVDDGRDVSAWLREKKCLVVVDDVSSPEEWQHIWQCLAAMGEDGRIVVTTRQEDVARRCGGEYELKPLARKESLKLLCHKVINTCRCQLFQLELLFLNFSTDHVLHITTVTFNPKSATINIPPPRL